MVQLKKEYSLPGNDEFWVEELEADGKEWICLSSHGLSDSHFFYFWSKPAEEESAMPSGDVIGELVRRLAHVHDQADRYKLKELVKFKTLGWDQWSFGTPGAIADYLYGPSLKKPGVGD